MQMEALRELPDMSNGNTTRNTTCDICLCLRRFLCSEVNIPKSGNTIPNSIYFCILAIVGVGNTVVSLKSRYSWMRGMLFVLF